MLEKKKPILDIPYFIDFAALFANKELYASLNYKLKTHDHDHNALDAPNPDIQIDQEEKTNYCSIIVELDENNKDAKIIYKQDNKGALRVAIHIDIPKEKYNKNILKTILDKFFEDQITILETMAKQYSNTMFALNITYFNPPEYSGRFIEKLLTKNIPAVFYKDNVYRLDSKGEVYKKDATEIISKHSLFNTNNTNNKTTDEPATNMQVAI
jgi:hypothetical protein